MQNTRLYVVETDDDIYLGTVETREAVLVIRTGFRGHPFEVPVAVVVSMIVADMHPDVVTVTPKRKAKGYV